MRRLFLTLISVSALAVLAACGAAATTSSSSGTGSGSGTSTSPTVSTGTTSLGTVLTDEHGLTLYYFLPQKGGVASACSATCLTAWPPVVVTGSPTSSSGVTGTLSTVSIMLNGASVNEVTYNGWPLHTFSGDSASGQTNGQNVDNTWFAAEPGTTADETGATTAGTTSSTPPPAATPSSTSTGGYGY
jgi:predicted lipoprotein with Yx(FWY)xxD motif